MLLSLLVYSSVDGVGVVGSCVVFVVVVVAVVFVELMVVLLVVAEVVISVEVIVIICFSLCVEVKLHFDNTSRYLMSTSMW